MPVSTLTSPYGVLPDGRAVNQYVLTNAAGVRVVLLDYGAMLASVQTPDRHGVSAEITHGYDDLAGWRGDTSYFGATIGRFGNRIAAGKFSLDGKSYTLATNNTPAGQPCHLHGGPQGFNKCLWSGRVLTGAEAQPGAQGVEFTYVSADGEEGYPGTLTVKTTYWLTDANELKITYEATTDRPTIVNLTNHAYWNLTGDPRQTITGHVMHIEADELVPVTSGLIPTGKLMAVAGTPFDFRQPTTVGARIDDATNEQLRFGNGYDHCWVLRGGVGTGLRLAARVNDPVSGRGLELHSDQPGMQLYSGNFLDGTATGRGGVKYPFRSAFCLEPQFFPDSPNQPNFPSTTLRPGDVYRHRMEYRFTAS